MKDTAHTKTETTDKSSGFLTTTTTTTKTEDYVESLSQAGVNIGGKSKLTTEGDLNLTAANLKLGQGADILADNVNVTGLALNEMHSKETHSSTSLNLALPLPQ